ncbi:MAG: fasciclin domain-containing protein [Bacteroidales bacterium]
MNDRNRILYTVDNPIKQKFVMGKYIMSDPDYSKFAALLISTKLLDNKYIDQTTKDTIPQLRFLNEATAWTGFIPSNAAMTEAELAGIIPSNTDTLKLFLQYHFIRKNAICDDGLVSGVFPSQRIESVSAIEGTKYATLQVTNAKDNMTVTDHSGQVVAVDHSTANHLTRKGVAHKINHVLKY